MTCKNWKVPKNCYINGKDKPSPSISIKELSYLLSGARKQMLKKSFYSQYPWRDVAIEEMFKEIRKKLELRRRGRK